MATKNKTQDDSLQEQARLAFSRIEAACPEDGKVVGKYIACLRQQNVIALGNGEAFALTDAEGRSIKATKRMVRLNAENGGLCQPVYKGPYVISAPGYSMLAHTAGAVVMNAPTVIVDGVQQQNPYVRRGTDGSIIEVHCRSIAFRYNENGQPMVSDRTTIFDTATYALADMIGKAKKCKDAFKILPSTMPSPDTQEWACYRVDEAINLWMNITHEDVINFLGQVLNRKKKALEFAQTFAQRNALKHLFGISVVPGQGVSRDCTPISQWDVPVVCWQPADGGLVRFDTARYAASTQIIEALSAGKPVELPEAKAPIVISRGTDEVSGGDMYEEADPLENPDRYESDEPRAAAMQEPIREKGPTIDLEPQAENWTSEQQRDWRNLEVARESLPEEYVAALSQLGLTEDTVNPGNASSVNSAIGRMLE